MSMVCPQCSQVYAQQERICPTCSVHLLFYAPIAPSATTATAEEDASGHWQHSSWGRVVVGLILAQGLALGLKQLLTAGFLARGDATSGLWGTVTGLALLHSFHALGLLVGGAVAGAGQERGTFVGCLVGLGNGMIFLTLQPFNQLLPDLYHFGQPLLHVVFGGIGGWIGSSIWMPTPRLVLPQTKSNLPAPPLFEARWLHGPIAWWRVIGGATLMACGAVWSNLIMKWMIETSQGALNVQTHFQARLISWEIAGLTMIAGACLAGATTWNGAKQGLCVGVGGAVLYLGYQLANPVVQLEAAVFAVMCMVGLGIAGGWFGGHLFPPVGHGRRGRRIIDL
ncbi:MAG: hypothetical protein L0Y71_25420 [Gemmataceae bacterium]|nr:hypothetical protein [Gemmataceae bacterium]